LAAQSLQHHRLQAATLLCKCIYRSGSKQQLDFL